MDELAHEKTEQAEQTATWVIVAGALMRTAFYLGITLFFWTAGGNHSFDRPLSEVSLSDLAGDALLNAGRFLFPWLFLRIFINEDIDAKHVHEIWAGFSYMVIILGLLIWFIVELATRGQRT